MWQAQCLLFIAMQNDRKASDTQVNENTWMVFFDYKEMPIFRYQESLSMCWWISTYPYGLKVLCRSAKTGVIPHKSRVDNMASFGQFLPYHTTVTDVSLKETSTCCMMCSFPLFSLNIITKRRPNTLEKEMIARSAFKERTLYQQTHTYLICISTISTSLETKVKILGTLLTYFTHSTFWTFLSTSK